jgi:acetyl-CoA C-acetyltransferase
MEQNEIVIVAAKRTPIGNMLGSLSSLTAPELGAVAHKGAIEQAGISPDEIDEVITGCVLQAGIGQAPGRQAAIKAGIPDSVSVSTINKMCGSGMKAVMLAHDLLKVGSANVILASGMESMSNAPYLLMKARAGYRLGHGDVKDHMILDGLEDAYEHRLMGYFAESTASRYHFSRNQQDEFTIRSLTRALQAQKDNSFAEEIVPVVVVERKGEVTVTQDEGPDEKKLAKIPNLRPVFKEDGTVTAANSSSISDGAASLILMTANQAKKYGLQALARVIAHASHSQAPQWFTTAPIEAIRKVLTKAGWQQNEVDLYEINEAFAVVAMAAIRELELDIEKVNIHGGACALGHPIGSSGARIIVTLMHALQQKEKTRGVAALCIGGGEATAVAIEMI